MKSTSALLSQPPLPVVNIAAYRFAPLADLAALRAGLLAFCRSHQLRGTILLSAEGINLFVAGGQQGIDALLERLRAVPGLAGLEAKVSHTAHQPFRRMLVRIKKEIIAFGVPGIDPARRTSPKLSPRQLKAWLDEGRPVTLLDTRNDYEVKLGTFQNALAAGVDHFRDFPEAVSRLPEALKDQTIVMFCTGGIRCEKAGPYMESQGFRNVLQLEGGILKYFEECGGAHYQGECFVFDQRVGVDPSLHETDAAQCFNCLSPLTAAEQQDPRYVAGRSCPWCHRTAAEEMAEALARRNRAISEAVNPLPGSVPAETFRPLRVPQECDGLTVVETFSRLVSHLPTEHWEEECLRGNLLDSRHQILGPDHIARAGDRLLHRLPCTTEPPVNGRVTVLYEDEALVVLNKPAPLPMHAGGRYTRNTLQQILNTVYRPQKPRPAHRLDANTTGVVIVARNRHFAGRLQAQFAQGQVTKSYLVRVHGHPVEPHFQCDAPITREAGEAGTREVDTETGLPALTTFKVLQRHPDGTSLLEALPATGRTNQIRIHCAFLGFPVAGDVAYSGAAREIRQTLDPEDPPLCLHAWRIGFAHPVSGEAISFTAPPPGWAA
ncbi:MAG TPA: sulfurtransferase [Steroidobacteraceae bacterium]|nr:sulfurtransferase [Steroidobacteraceae bacterium]